MPHHHHSITWSVWQQLNNPAEHPIYRRTIRSPGTESNPVYTIWLVLVISGGVAAGLWVLLGPTNPSALMLALAGVILFNSSLYAVVWAVSISSAIQRERGRGVYDLLAALPPGGMGLHLIIAGAILHHHDALPFVTLLRRFTIVLALIIFAMLLLTVALQPHRFDALQLLRLLLDMLVVAAAAYLDHVQSVTLASSIGMLIPAQARAQFDNRFWPAFLFLLLQFLTAGGTLFVALVIFPGVVHTLALTGWLVELSPPLIYMLIFYGLREAALRGVWRALDHSLS